MPAAAEGPDVLICALSGRALAQAARACGLRPVVLDAFADLDTRAAAVRFARIPLTKDWRFVPDRLLQAAAELAPPPIPLVFGAGFERDWALLAALAKGRPLWGTAPEAVARVKDPELFAAACQRLALPHPETRTSPPPAPRGWLVKRRGGAGGGHIRPASRVAPTAAGDVYWQRRVAGTPVSLLASCDGYEAMPLAITRQWTAPGRGLRFSGVSLPLALPPAIAAQLADAARKLCRHFSLRGLISLDVLVEGENLWLLEINPRPTASLDALWLATGVNPFRLHLAGIQGQLAEPPPLTEAAASEILFASRPLTIPRGWRWPDWVRDRTPPAATVPARGPIATVVATATTTAAARRLVLARRAWLRAALEGGRCATEAAA